MATEIKHRRGITTEILGFTPAIAELVMDVTLDELILGNGVKTGGIRIPTVYSIDKKAPTLQAILDDNTLSENQFVEVRERVAGKGGTGVWKVVDNQAVTANTSNKIAHPVLPFVLVLQESDILRASAWGIFPNDTVDITVYKDLIAHHQTVGKSIQFAMGEYDFLGADVSNGGLTNGQSVGSINCEGIGAVFKNIGTAHFTGKVSFKFIKFKNCIQPVYMTGAVNIDILFSEFEGCRRSIYHNDNTIGATVGKSRILFTHIHSHEEDEFIGGILLQRALNVNDVEISHCVFEDLVASSTGVNAVIVAQVGNSSVNTVENYRNNKFNDNIIRRCGNNSATYKVTSFGCIITGLDSDQNNNRIYDNYWLQSVYAKGNGNHQLHNTSRNNQFSGITMKVYDATLESRENIQDGNIVRGQCDKRAAVRMFGSGRSINSQVDITTTGQVDVSQGGLAYQATNSSTTDGELTVTGSFKAPKGIQITTAGDVNIDVRLISDTNGLIIQDSTAGLLGTVNLAGKVVCGDGQGLRVDEAAVVKGDIEVVCNASGGINSIFVQANEKIDLRGSRLVVTDNLSDGIAITTPVDLFSTSGGRLNTQNIMLDGFEFYTERNFTQVMLLNDGSAPVAGGSITKLQWDGGDVDLNGKSGTSLIKCLTHIKKISLGHVEIDGALSLTVDGGGKTVDKLLINECVTDYVASDNIAGHTNTTVTRSRIGNNLTV